MRFSYGYPFAHTRAVSSGGLPNLILVSLLALSFVPYFLPAEIRETIPGFT